MIRLLSIICLGLLITSNAWASVCERSPVIVGELEEWFDKSCEEITAEDLTVITELDIYKGGSSVKSGDLDGLTELQSLNLELNLTEIPADFFTTNKKLKKFMFYGVKLKTLPPGLFNGLDMLEWVDVSGRLETIPDRLFANLPRLKWISLYANKNLKSLPENTFEGSTAIEIIDLSYNKIIRVAPQTFTNMPALRYLAIDAPTLSNSPSLPIQTVIARLHSTDTNESINEKMFSQMPNLKSAFIGSLETFLENINELPENLFKNTQLESIVIASIDIIPSPELFRGLTTLKQIALRNLNLEMIDTPMMEVLKSLPNLKILQLDRNYFKEEERNRIRKELPHVQVTF